MGYKLEIHQEPKVNINQSYNNDYYIHYDTYNLLLGLRFWRVNSQKFHAVPQEDLQITPKIGKQTQLGVFRRCRSIYWL